MYLEVSKGRVMYGDVRLCTLMYSIFLLFLTFFIFKIFGKIFWESSVSASLIDSLWGFLGRARIGETFSNRNFRGEG